MSILELWVENDWVIKILIIATFVVLVIAFEKMYQFFKVTKALNVEYMVVDSSNSIEKIYKKIEEFIYD